MLDGESSPEFEVVLPDAGAAKTSANAAKAMAKQFGEEIKKTAEEEFGKSSSKSPPVQEQEVKAFIINKGALSESDETKEDFIGDFKKASQENPREALEKIRSLDESAQLDNPTIQSGSASSNATNTTE